MDDEDGLAARQRRAGSKNKEVLVSSETTAVKRVTFTLMPFSSGHVWGDLLQISALGCVPVGRERSGLCSIRSVTSCESQSAPKQRRNFN